MPDPAPLPAISPNIVELLKQPPQTSAYWLGRWRKWQQQRLQEKAKKSRPK